MKELEIVQHRQIDGLSLFFDSVTYRTAHFHAEWELIWVTDGTLDVHCETLDAVGKAGDLFLFCPGQLHAFSGRAGETTFLCLQMRPEAFGAMFLELERLVPEDFCLSRQLTEESARVARRTLAQMMAIYLDRDPLYTLSCVSETGRLLQQLLLAVPCRSVTPEERVSTDQRNARLRRMIRFVDENHMHKIRLTDFAEQEHCSVSYLSRFIKESMNRSFQDYVNFVRFRSACRLIAGGGMRMLDVCEEAGFSDYRYFSAAFKKYSGMTPEEYSRRGGQQTELPQQQSLHSVERFYTREESRLLLKALHPD